MKQQNNKYVTFNRSAVSGRSFAAANSRSTQRPTPTRSSCHASPAVHRSYAASSRRLPPLRPSLRCACRTLRDADVVFVLRMATRTVPLLNLRSTAVVQPDCTSIEVPEILTSTVNYRLFDADPMLSSPTGLPIRHSASTRCRYLRQFFQTTPSSVFGRSTSNTA
jgi:hypothetical protein